MPDLVGPKTLYIGFCGAIDSAGVGRIAGTLNEAVNQQFDAVHMTFTSNGGFVSDGIYLYNHIRSLPISVTIHNMGMVASIAASIYAAADRRTACANAMFMIHPVHTQPNGALAHAALRSTLESAIADEERIDAILKDRTAIPDEVLTRRRSVDLFFAADKALEYGLVHEVCDFALPSGNQVFNI
ncbi:MAG: ATP-dependent Clp protease proteolytic subunit [Sphingomonas sp.]